MTKKNILSILRGAKRRCKANLEEGRPFYLCPMVWSEGIGRSQSNNLEEWFQKNTFLYVREFTGDDELLNFENNFKEIMVDDAWWNMYLEGRETEVRTLKIRFMQHIINLVRDNKINKSTYKTI